MTLKLDEENPSCYIKITIMGGNTLIEGGYNGMNTEKCISILREHINNDNIIKMMIQSNNLNDISLN